MHSRAAAAGTGMIFVPESVQQKKSYKQLGHSPGNWDAPALKGI